MRVLRVLCVAGLVPAALLAQSRSETTVEPFSIETLLAAPFPEDLTASPDGRAVAWLADEAGRRNVWVAEAPEWRARRLTRYLTDDGQELSGLVWTADSRGLLYVRGGDSGSNWDRTVPVNPTSNPRGTEQAVWFVPLRGAIARRIGDGHFPVPSPKSDQVVWFLRDTLRVAPLARAAAPQILIRERGATDEPAWSPDGRRIAFTSRRRDHSYVGIYDLQGRTIEWISPGTFRDDHPQWSPDGSKVAFIRRAGAPYAGGPALPRIQGDGAPPFTIRVADPATRDSREIWRSPNSPEGAFPGSAGSWGLMWANDERLLFASEQTGWIGLYSVGVQGGDATRLTPTGCEIQDVQLARDRNSVLYSSNCGDIDRRHVQRVDLSGSGSVANGGSGGGGEGGSGTSGAGRTGPQDVTTGAGIEWAPVFLADGKIAVLHSDARRPAAPALVDSGAAATLAGWPLPEGFPVDQLVEPQQVIVRAADSTEIHCQLFLPPTTGSAGAATGRMPAVMFFHGGPSREMLLGWHYMGYYHNSYAFNQYLASRGFIVLSVNYRGGIGYGRAFRDAPRRGRSGASEYQDLQAAAQWLRARSDVDTLHVGLWGGSYGGYMTSLGLARNSDLFAAGFDLHGVHDYAEESGLTRASGASDSTIALARRASAIGDVEHWRSPVLLVAGDDDRNVHFQQTVDLAVRLRRMGVHVEELIFVDDTHHFLKHANWVAAYRAGAGFFAEHLRR